MTPSFNLLMQGKIQPKLALDFTIPVLDPRISVVRALGTATRINSSGIVEAVAANGARFNYNPSTLACKGLLVEEPRSNDQQYSEDFSSWNKTNTSVSANSSTAPDGTNTADLITASANGGLIYKLNTTTNGATYTLSIFLKKSVGNTVNLDFTNVAQGPQFNFSTETFTGGYLFTGHKVEKFPNGWYRVSAQRVCGTTSAGMQLVFANANDACYSWGAQLEIGAFATSYIPNIATGSTSRNGDVLTMTGTNFTDWYNQTSGTFFLQYTEDAAAITSGGRMLCDTVQNRLPLYQISASALGSYDNTSGNVTFASGALVANGVNKAASAWNASNRFGCSNAGAVVSGGFDGNYDLSGLRIFSAYDNTSWKSSHLQKLSFYPLCLSSSEMQAITR